MMKYIVMLILSVSPIVAPADITSVTVLDSKFDVIKELNDKKELKAFQELWLKKDGRLLQRKILMRYKLDISENGKSTRWLYSKHGWTTVLSKKVSKQYELEPTELTQLLGIKQK